jgi:hypothetical protein
MPVKLTIMIRNIQPLENSVNRDLIQGFYNFLKSNNMSETYQNQKIKALIKFSKFLDPDKDFYELSKKNRYLHFLTQR